MGDKTNVRDRNKSKVENPNNIFLDITGCNALFGCCSFPAFGYQPTSGGVVLSSGHNFNCVATPSVSQEW